LRPAQADSSQDPNSKLIRAKWAGGVAQAVEAPALQPTPPPTTKMTIPASTVLKPRGNGGQNKMSTWGGWDKRAGTFLSCEKWALGTKGLLPFWTKHDYSNPPHKMTCMVCSPNSKVLSCFSVTNFHFPLLEHWLCLISLLGLT
jgi:hypothetical protein